jgi:5-methyltetrahydrofolate--homocysteine methyltransferase
MIRFSDKQWDNVIDNYRKWWKGELGRPILPLIINGADPGRAMPKAPLLHLSNCADLSIPAEAIIDRLDYELSTYEFYGDSFPWVPMHSFGAGVVAAFLGAVLESDKNTVWFHPPKKKVPIEDLHLSYDGNNVWLRRIKDIYREGMKKWGDSVCMAMTDLGGGMDILASFLTTEGLLFAVTDQPKEVLRLCQEITDLWLQFFEEMGEIIKDQRVFSDWSSRLSEKPSYMLQCDFCYMIGPEMFKDFVHDELDKTAKTLENSFYHLDGIGELVHLDSLLSIDSIKGIQWIPGDGEPEKRDWSELYAKISASGKKIMAGYRMDQYLDDILKVIKKPDDLIKMQFTYATSEKEKALKTLAHYGAV